MERKDFAISNLGKAQLPSPLADAAFQDDSRVVPYSTDVAELEACVKAGKEIPGFEIAGPRAKIFHDPAWTRAAILTAGGLCPGLNDVIKFITIDLMEHYHVPVVYGIRYGYKGLNPIHGFAPLELNPTVVDAIHTEGGTILGSSRGNEDPEIMVDTLIRMRINLLFCIGGDGTARGAHAIVQSAEKRRFPLSVICVPKTIDNDINFIDQSFGFATAVLHAGPVLSCAHNEAKGAPNGVGVVKVMGRDSGFIAAFTALANPYANYCLIPEDPFTLEDGPRALLPHLLQRLKEKQHAVIIVAEGAGQDLITKAGNRYDASGNLLHDDIGEFLTTAIRDYSKKNNFNVTVKYFDPGYTIRSVPAAGEDAVFCAMLAQAATHAAMAGKTDMVVGHWNGEFTHVPISLATSSRKKIDLTSPLWAGVKSICRF